MQLIENLARLGARLKASDAFKQMLETAHVRNPWFVPQFAIYAADAVIDYQLNEKALHHWLEEYPGKPVNKTVGLIFAGNVPLVGMHDFICCYVAGCKIKIKPSTKDELFDTVLKELGEVDANLKNRVEVVDRLKDFDAVIATGSDNTNRYFEYYFRNHPKILRKSRNSVAILTGNETDEELEHLADDMFLYFGFGCRNVSKLYVPVNYDFQNFFPRLEKYKWMHAHSKYMNNYDYNRTILLLNKTPHLSNDYIMLQESTSIASPISTIYYEHWHDEKVLQSLLKQNAEKIQCIVTSHPNQWELSSLVKMGKTQHPSLSDYADGVDTMEFLLGL